MKILLVAEIDKQGGARTYFEALVKVLKEEKIEFFVLIAMPSEDATLSLFAKKNNFEYHILPKRSKCSFYPFLNGFYEVKTLFPFVFKHKPDLILISNSNFGQWLSVFLLPTPSLQILHTAISRVGKWQPLYLHSVLWRFSAKRRLATVSQYAAKQMAKFWKKTPDVIYNCTTFPAVVREEKSNSFASQIVTAGHVVAYKNPIFWLEVAKRVLELKPEAKFSWYGDGPMLMEMQQKTKDMENINFYGAALDMKPIYSNADIYFQPSIYESHGIAVLEAMSYGLPCVVSDQGGLPESVVHEVTGYVESMHDAENMAQKIYKLLDNPEHAKTMGQAGKDKVQEDFMPETWKKKTLSLIKSCITGE